MLKGLTARPCALAATWYVRMRSAVTSTGANWSSRRLNPLTAAARIPSRLPAPTHIGGCGFCVVSGQGGRDLSRARKVMLDQKNAVESKLLCFANVVNDLAVQLTVAGLVHLLGGSAAE